MNDEGMAVDINDQKATKPRKAKDSNHKTTKHSKSKPRKICAKRPWSELEKKLEIDIYIK